MENVKDNLKDTRVMLRTSKELLKIVDKVGEQFGLSRSEVFRCGAIYYCQSLLLMGSMDGLYKTATALAKSELVEKPSDEDLKNLEQLKIFTEQISNHLGVPLIED